jgi:hypothetical protein
MALLPIFCVARSSRTDLSMLVDFTFTTDSIRGWQLIPMVG